ncbi:MULTISPECIES: hypothetical protein [Leptolyngbya]|uniref:hypothetical protein n=1 Tax=Leptolyngbya TaxID=47251 RepID=UPI0016888EE8|nr:MULTISPECIES: hypothetical protein [unclassified Leptolyngbya]MBD1855549.1 hypothetical protein [Leptolyngbya sp. FACHB-1624]MBN8563589.1 hypothetical protein [Leptolyngbya sp. UWPOB_LEPTO1]
METKQLEGGGLSVPVCYVTQLGERQWLEPQILRHTLLEQLFSSQDLKSLALVKLDRASLNADNLKAARFEDGMIRKLTFSSDRNFYFADPTLAEQITQFFAAERDAACRYGSLLVSDCYKGTTTIETLKLKLVDYTDPEFAAYKTHDCHGRISPQLMRSLAFDGTTPDRPFQFRMAHTASSDLGFSFLAKGTVLVDPTLPSNVDFVLDRSSIKGIHKDQLEALPCGEYELSQVVLGNRANAEVARYSNSWQFSMWYSKSAVLADFLKPTLKKAQELAEKQRDPKQLAQYVVQRYDQEQSDTEGDEQEPQESRMISILRHDRYGLLLYAPKVVDFLESQTASRWRELAVNSGFQHSSGMAQPGRELPRGMICAPHLPKGNVVVTRYPIVSSDNIRIYRNVHDPTLSQTEGVVWINPRDAAEYHQCDFDGDQLIATPAQWIPNIAKETLRAGEPNRFPSIVKRPKVPYTEVQTEQGQFVYNTLPKVAAAVCQNGIGRVAMLIGRVHTAVPTEEESASPHNQRQFEKSRHQLLNRLMAALQVEVDSPKSAERTETIDPKLLDDAKQWCEKHPSPFFDFQKDPRLYRQFALPTQASGQPEVSVVCVLAAEINPLWEATQLQSLPREHFRYLFDRAELDTDALDWAENLKERAQQATAQIRQLVGEDAEGFRVAISALNESFRAEINETFSTPEEQRSIAAAIWYTQHTRPELDRPRKQSMSVAAKLPITFSQGTYSLPKSPYELEAHELSVPFDRAQTWMQMLEARHIEYEAIVNPALPVVDFYLPTLSERNAAVLQQQFGHQVVDVDRIPNDLRVVPPADFTWAHSVGDTGKASLAYTLMTEQVTEQLQNFEVSQIKVIGITHNDYANEDFSRWQGQIEIEVVPYALEPEHPKYYAMNGIPVLQVVGGGVLGTFAPETAKLPIGTRFEATVEDFTRSMVQLRVSDQLVLSPEPSISDEQNAVQRRLAAAIAQTYQLLSSPAESVELPIGERWTAIASITGDYTVEDNGNRLVCQGNFASGAVSQFLSQTDADEFQQMMQQRDAGSRKRQSIVER